MKYLKKLPEIIGQRFSWHSILNDLGKSIKSVDTIQKYFEYLAYSFIISTVYSIDPSTKTIKFKKALNQTHPFLYGNLNSRDS